MNLDKYSCHARDKTNQNGSRDVIDVLFLDKGLFIFYEVGGLVEFFEPPLRITMAPHSVLIFPHTPPNEGHFWGVTPPFKRDIIIKPDMYIFCSVQYDLYYLFNVKLLTTHSTDVAATSVNSKNKFCPFAKALLHYFSNIKNIENQKKEKSISDLRFMDLPERVVAGLSTSSSSSIKARMTSSPPELMESLSFLSLSSLSLLLYSSSSLSLSCNDLNQLHLFLSVVFATLMDQGLQDSFGEANA